MKVNLELYLCTYGHKLIKHQMYLGILIRFLVVCVHTFCSRANVVNLLEMYHSYVHKIDIKCR